MRSKIVLLLALASVGVALSRFAPAAPEQPPSDPLVELNRTFREAHARARKQALTQTGPVILVSGDDLVLLRNGKRTEARVIPDLYHTLKTVSHVPTAVYLLLAPYGDATIDDKRLTESRDYRRRIAAVREALEKRGLSNAQLKRQCNILDGSAQFLDAALEAKRAKPEDVRAFARKMGPLVLANADEAATAQLDGLHKQMKGWKRELSADEWKRLRVVIQGSALPRKDNLAVQFFARLLGEKGEGLRIVYAESLWDEDGALNLLGVNLVDAGLGDAFFDDKSRMHRDLLSDAAAEQLKKMTFE